ncbi:MAG: VCBS repeat-containing protein [Alphaproteobacteria bacterium]|nr:VCBS repeat-containing protein [Alphaproteobacteria bacterium]MCB9792201.1 VCBS repeat-containing protein [Alphaproteobacteria bacterium]
MLLLLLACIDNQVVNKDDEGGPVGADSGQVECPPQIPDCRDSEADDSGPPDSSVDSQPQDCELTLAEATEVPVEPECEGEGGGVEDPWDLSVEWRWTGLSSDALVADVLTAPMVAQLDDDNGDGQIDDADLPELVVIAADDYHWNQAHFVILDGATGAERATWPGTDGSAGLAVGDVDLDGVPDIVGVTPQGYVEVYDAQGNRTWTSSPRPVGGSYPQVTLVDLDGDGAPEIIAGRGVLDGQTGTYEANLIPTTGVNYTMASVGDIDLRGSQEIILGDTAFSAAGAVLWRAGFAGTSGHWSAIVQADGDPEAEVVMIGGGNLGIYQHDGAVIFEASVGSARPGPPCVADFDGDGVSEVVWAATDTLHARELDGSPLWTAPISDTSGFAACSAFDFDADGAYEVVYADEQALMILDGGTGAELARLSDHASGTVVDYPTIADVDGDGAAELLLVSNDYAFSGWSGVSAIGSSGGWPEVGRSWSVHDLNATNTLPDGQIPVSPSPAWLNGDLLRARPPLSLPATPDLSARILELCVADCELGPVKVSVQVFNEGGADVAAGAPWAVYRVDGGARTLVATGSLPALASGEAAEGLLLVLDPEDVGDHGFAFVVDDDGSGQGQVAECDEQDNEALWSSAICD